MSVSVATDRFAVRGDLSLLHRSWRPDGPTRALALVHGLAEHSARYDQVARWFAGRGFAVHAYDQRGHGESEGPRVYTPDFGQLLDDAEQFLERVRGLEPGAPLVLLGHSMGGLIVASLLVERRPRVDAAVLSGPALAAPALGAVMRTLVRTLSRVAPRTPIPSTIEPESLSRDPEVVAAYLADPLVPRRYSARLVSELLRAMERVEGCGGDVEVPLLIVHGADDAVCDAGGSRRFAADLLPAGCAFRPYPGLRHEVLNEPEREQVMADIAEWIDKHLGAS